MKVPPPARLLLIGLGNDYRGDDAAGRVTARRMKAEAPPGMLVREETGEGTALMEAWKGAPFVIVVDAVRSGAAPGTVHRFEAHARSIPAGFFHYSTHAFSLAEAVELARALGELPPRLLVLGIEGGDFSEGEHLSPGVQAAIDEVLAAVRREVQTLPVNPNE